MRLRDDFWACVGSRPPNRTSALTSSKLSSIVRLSLSPKNADDVGGAAQISQGVVLRDRLLLGKAYQG